MELSDVFVKVKDWLKTDSTILGLVDQGKNIFMKSFYPSIEETFHEVNQHVNVQTQKVGLGTFVDYWDYLYLSYGTVEGAINVLPDDSILAGCNGNATLVDDHYYMFVNNLTDTLNFLHTIESSADLFSYTTFDCYYSLFSIVDPQTYATLFSDNNFLFNLLYNLGYMYSDVSNFISLDHTDTTKFPENRDYWRQIGKHVGDFTIRIFYRAPVIRATSSGI